MDKPVLNLRTLCTPPITPLKTPFVDLASTFATSELTDPILTLSTRVTDGERTATLGSLIKSVTEEHKLTLASDVEVSDGTQVAPFDFKYDEETEKFGAGTAFLQPPPI
jgi:hypothetical protein